MNNHGVITAKTIHAVLVEEMRELGGTVPSACEMEYLGSLHARGVLPRKYLVGPGDAVQGGVAVRFCPLGLCVRPYVFRQVCQNGAIMARAMEAWEVPMAHVRHADDVVEELRTAIVQCAADEAIENAVSFMRAARNQPLSRAEMGIMVMAMVGDAQRGGRAGLVSRIMDRIDDEDDLTRFGLMNAVTALARDTEDSPQRWRLEELGGSIPALPWGPRPSEPLVSRARRAESVYAG